MALLKIPPNILVSLFLRSFLLQASWNFERLQGLGALYVLAPALRFLYRDEDLARAYGRHTEYFNTHPYLAPGVLGATLHLEEQLAAGETTEFGVEDFKRMLMAPCAAMGDAFFWGGVRPLASVLALFFAVRGLYWATLVLLLVFNVPHLWFRTVGLGRGYRLGAGMIGWLQQQHLPDWALRLKEATVVLLGGLCAYLTVLTLAGEQLGTLWGLLVLPLVALLGWISGFGVSPLLLSLGLSSSLLLFFSLA